jgi:hypothetical protein
MSREDTAILNQAIVHNEGQMVDTVQWTNRITGYGNKPASQFMAHPDNWRIHPQRQRSALKGSLDTLGWVDVVIDERIWQALKNNDAEVPFITVDLSPEEEAQALLSLDAIAALAQTDAGKVDELLRMVSTDNTDVMQFLTHMAKDAGLDYGQPPEDAPEPQIDRAAELQEKWQTATGQLWEIGQHRLICGDCTDKAVVDRVMGGERAQLAVTSPPYGVGKSYETKGIGPWTETVRPAIKLLCEYADVIVWQIVDWYCTGSQFIEPTFAYSINMFGENGYRPIWIRIWEKQGTNFGVAPYHLVSNKPAQQYEYIGAVASETAIEELTKPDTTDYEWLIGMAGHRHKYIRRLTDQERRDWGYSGVWKMNTVQANKDHPAMFPVELPKRCIKMHSDPEGIVIEPFSGSGTTLCACELLSRKCRAIEISPAYVAVSLQRLADMGLEPRLVE